VELIDPEDLRGGGPSTHGPAPTVFLQAVRMLHRCRCVVLGIQPQRTEFGRDLSTPVSAAVQRIVEAFDILAPEPDGRGPSTP
jgi:Ni,Fe-hydrogenase maturation factor